METGITKAINRNRILVLQSLIEKAKYVFVSKKNMQSYIELISHGFRICKMGKLEQFNLEEYI